MTNLTFNELLKEHRDLLDDSTYVNEFEFYTRGKQMPKNFKTSYLSKKHIGFMIQVGTI